MKVKKWWRTRVLRGVEVRFSDTTMYVEKLEIQITGDERAMRTVFTIAAERHFSQIDGWRGQGPHLLWQAPPPELRGRTFTRDLDSLREELNSLGVVTSFDNRQ